jgi:hypothetical protein
MKFLPFLLLAFLSSPAKAITWGEFWEPFRSDEHHHHHYDYGHHHVPMCRRKLYNEEYVPGYYTRHGHLVGGYVRRWYEWVSVPCDSHNY